MKFITNSNLETKKILKEILKKFPKNRIFCLYGDLGSGKTTFMKGIAGILDMDEKQIKSPTFTILNKYKNRDKIIYHLDLYRINNFNELLNIGIEEVFEDYNSKIFIEWAERIKDFLPKKRLDINFKYLDDNTREISVLMPNE